MRVLKLFEEKEVKPFGMVGVDNAGVLFTKGVDEDLRDWLENGIDDENGVVFTPKEGGYLEAVKNKLEQSVLFGELNVEGPEQIDSISDSDLQELKGGE